jgi:hypothetical protein
MFRKLAGNFKRFGRISAGTKISDRETENLKLALMGRCPQVSPQRGDGRGGIDQIPLAFQNWLVKEQMLHHRNFYMIISACDCGNFGRVLNLRIYIF